MKEAARTFKLFSDETRLRLLMLLSQQELCVCQLMAVLDVSQPLVSRNLSTLYGEGLLDERRQGKLVFYMLKRKLPEPYKSIWKIISAEYRDDKRFKRDMTSLGDCMDYQKKTGKCDMKTFLEFMEKQRKKRKR